MLPPRATLASLTSSRLESLGAALAFGSDHGPPLPARRRSPARARPPPLSPLPPPLGPGSAPRPWARAPRATAPGAGSFSSAAAALRPLPPDVRRGGGSSGGRGRDAKAGPGGGCDPPRPAGPPAPRRRARTPAPPRALLPGASEPRSAPQRQEVGRGRDSGHCLGGIGLTRSFRSVPQGQPRAGQLGSGMGLRSSPRCSSWNQRGQTTSGRASEGGVPGETEAPFSERTRVGLSFGSKFFVSWPQRPLAPAVRLERVLPARKTH